MIEDMYKIMAIADYEDRFVIPTAHRELAEEDIRACAVAAASPTAMAARRHLQGLFGNKRRGLTIPEAMKS